ncbi:MAG: hypothetical protein AAGI72_03010 [Pseudomonadota bacterium]
MARVLIMAVGFVFLLIGFIGVLTPIPFGLVFLLLALLMLIPTTPGVARLVQRARRRSSRFDQLMILAIRKSPAPYRRILRRTDVDPYAIN